MLWWTDRRGPEVQRRQRETVANADIAARSASSALLMYKLRELSAALPTAGKASLLAVMRGANAGRMSDVAVAESVQKLVDDYNVTVLLTHKFECNVRAKLAPSWRTKKEKGPAAVAAVQDLHEDDEDDEHADADEEPCKRKRTQTLNGEGPKVDGEEDEDAVCPVCRDCPREDDRWVKCDGCSSWYHQICVLFNEQAHGKSVRFFCRTPGCRKRGSRQLNRRQRKPCYPTSTALAPSTLGDYLCSVVSPVARSDRPVLIRLAAHSRRQDRGGVVVHNKTLLAFQHTMTGSDLLIMAMFVEETRMTDGTAHAEVTRVDTNGLYEEERAGERAAVEHAIVQGYLQHVSHAGFATVSFPTGNSAPLFHGLPSSQAYAAGVWTCSLIQEALRRAHGSGLVHSVEARGPSWLVQLRAQGYYARAAPEEDVELETLALSQDDWLEAQAESNYSFDGHQFAKFSSMMLVYHLIKGWERGAVVRASPPLRSSLRAPANDSMLAIEVGTPEEEERASSPEEPAPKRRRAEPAAPDASLPWHNEAPAERSSGSMDEPCAPPPPPMMPERQSSWGNGSDAPPPPTMERQSSWETGGAPPPSMARQSSWGPEEGFAARRSMSGSLEPYERRPSPMVTGAPALARQSSLETALLGARQSSWGPVEAPQHEGSVSNFFGEFGGMFLDVAEELRAPGNEDSLWDSFLAGM